MKNDLPIIAPTPSEIARTLEDALALQRAAYFTHPVPTLAERKADLRTLQRFIRENKQALCDAISADYGHRSQHETLLAEMRCVEKNYSDSGFGDFRGNPSEEVFPRHGLLASLRPPG